MTKKLLYGGDTIRSLQTTDDNGKPCLDREVANVLSELTSHHAWPVYMGILENQMQTELGLLVNDDGDARTQLRRQMLCRVLMDQLEFEEKLDQAIALDDARAKEQEHQSVPFSRMQEAALREGR
jgi:hypothetical protein